MLYSYGISGRQRVNVDRPLEPRVPTDRLCLRCGRRPT